MKRYKKATPEERLDMIRATLVRETSQHGVPCMCVLCETLIFDSLYAEGERDIQEDLSRIQGEF